VSPVVILTLSMSTPYADAAIRYAAYHHALVLDLKVLDRGFHFLGGDLERLLPRVLGRLHHRHADGVDRLATGAEPGDGRDVGVAGGDLDLVDVDAVCRRCDLGQRDVRARDVHLAGQNLQ